MKFNFKIWKNKSFDFSSILDKKNFKPNKHYELNNKSTKDKFKTIKEIKENKVFEESNKINQVHEEKKNVSPYFEEEQSIDPKQKYKDFRYNLADEESKKRFESYQDYANYTKAMGLHHNSIFKIKNYFVRRNFLKLRKEEAFQEITEEDNANEKEKFEALEKLIDPSKEKLLLYEANYNILEMLNSDRRIIQLSLFTTTINNIYIMTSFKYLFAKTIFSYLFTYFFNISIFSLFLFYKKLANDCVLQAEYLPKTKEILVLKRKPYSFKVYEEKLSISDLKYFKSRRVYEKSSIYFRNVKNKKQYAFHENGIWHQEKVFNTMFGLKKDINSNYI